MLWQLVGERVTTRFLDFMGHALDPMLSPADGVRVMLAAYMDYWQRNSLSFLFNLWRLLEGPRSERRARSDHITRHGVALFQRARGRVHPREPAAGPGLGNRNQRRHRTVLAAEPARGTRLPGCDTSPSAFRRSFPRSGRQSRRAISQPAGRATTV